MKKNGKNNDKVSCDVEEIVGFLNEDRSKVLAKISWNGRPAKYEIRNCWDADSDLKIGKGIAVSSSEAKKLIKLLEKLPQPVDFDEVFKSAHGVAEKRSMGLRTVDGFAVLTPKKKDLFKRGQ